MQHAGELALEGDALPGAGRLPADAAVRQLVAGRHRQLAAVDVGAGSGVALGAGAVIDEGLLAAERHEVPAALPLQINPPAPEDQQLDVMLAMITAGKDRTSFVAHDKSVPAS